MDGNARPTAGPGGTVAATPALDCDAAKPNLEFTLTTRAEPLTLLVQKAPDRSGWRDAPGSTKEPTVRPVQWPLIDQQIAWALPLAQ